MLTGWPAVPWVGPALDAAHLPRCKRPGPYALHRCCAWAPGMPWARAPTFCGRRRSHRREVVKQQSPGPYLKPHAQPSLLMPPPCPPNGPSHQSTLQGGPCPLYRGTSAAYFFFSFFYPTAAAAAPCRPPPRCSACPTTSAPRRGTCRRPCWTEWPLRSRRCR
jgi:hypothetical protein